MRERSQSAGTESALSKSTETNSLVQALIKKAGKIGKPKQHRKASPQTPLVRREFCGCQRFVDRPASRDEPGRDVR